MLSSALASVLKHHNSEVQSLVAGEVVCPVFNPFTYYRDVANSTFIHVLARLRHCMEMVSDYHFSFVQHATKVDLFMLTTSVSSPMGPGSNSQAISIRFGPHEAFLTDSSQFGFEPLILNGFDKLYCYLPSMRGEDWDARHLNQFFHCEAEIKGDLAQIMALVEAYIGALGEALLLSENLCELLSLNPRVSLQAINELSSRMVSSGLRLVKHAKS